MERTSNVAHNSDLT